MANWSCWSALNLLDLHADARLAGPWAAWVSRHVAACASCRAAAEELAAVPRLLKAAGSPEVPAGLAEAVLKELKAPSPARARVAEPGPPAFLAWRPGPTAALAMGYAAFLLVLETVPVLRGTALPSQAASLAAERAALERPAAEGARG